MLRAQQRDGRLSFAHGLPISVGLVLGAIGLGCGTEPPAASSFRVGVGDPPRLAVDAPLPEVPCMIEVEGIGPVDLEADYLPQVVYCENNGAGPEALEAQAIAARSVAYYAIFQRGSICDSTDCQVYSCGGLAGPEHRAAVEATAHRYLMYSDTLTYGFYVAGDPAAAPPACVGGPRAPTEQWVTYNEGLSGTRVQQTDLGWVFDPAEPGYGQNRGCMSQWSARCLENDVDYDADAILRFFYGEDIVVATAERSCTAATSTGVADGSSESDAESGGTSGGPGGDGSTTTATTSSSDGPGQTSTVGASTNGGNDTSEPGSTTDAFGSSTSGGESPGADEVPDFYSGSCGCRSTPRPALPAVLGLVLVTARRRRRRRSRSPADPRH